MGDLNRSFAPYVWGNNCQTCQKKECLSSRDSQCERYIQDISPQKRRLNSRIGLHGMIFFPLQTNGQARTLNASISVLLSMATIGWH